MTYQELLALISPANAGSRAWTASRRWATRPDTARRRWLIGWYYADPNSARRRGARFPRRRAGSLLEASDAVTGNGGRDVTQYGANGQVDNQWFARTQHWLDDTCATWWGTIGGAALLEQCKGAARCRWCCGCAGGRASRSRPWRRRLRDVGPGGAAEVMGGAGASALSGGVAPAATSASRPAATGAIGSTGRAWARGVKMAGVPGMDVAGAPRNGGGGTDWMSLLRQGGSAVSSLLGGGPGVAALFRQCGRHPRQRQHANTQTGSSGLASWMMPYAQDVVARQQFMANQPATNWALDTSQAIGELCRPRYTAHERRDAAAAERDRRRDAGSESVH